jgi:hypothetical protein
MVMGLLKNIFSSLRETKEERAFNEQLKKDGLSVAVARCTKEINEKIPSKELAIKFLLQELDFSRKEEAFPEEFIFNSGFHQLEYEGALDRFEESKEDLEKIQTLFDTFLEKIKNEKEMIDISITILDSVMREWKIGKYSLARVEEEEPSDDQESLEESTQKISLEARVEEEQIEEMVTPLPLQYDTYRVNELMEEYSDIIGNIITGIDNSDEIERIEAFKGHISAAAQEGRSHYALVLSTFYEHGESYQRELPVSIGKMNDESLDFLMSILKRFAKKGFSQPFTSYMESHRDRVYSLAGEKNNKYLQYLVAFWYEDCDERRDDACLERKRTWYEKSALNGFVPAILRMGDLYSEGSKITEEALKKSAYWYREGALKNSSIDMYNLATLYAYGEGVSENLKTAQFWFSMAYQEGGELLKEQVLKEIKGFNMEIFDDPSLREDPELDPEKAELTDCYK